MFNFQPREYPDYRLRLADDCELSPVFSSDGADRETVKSVRDGQAISAVLDLFPLSAVFYSVSGPQNQDKSATPEPGDTPSL